MHNLYLLLLCNETNYDNIIKTKLKPTHAIANPPRYVAFVPISIYTNYNLQQQDGSV